jgi:hypothetical protein
MPGLLRDLDVNLAPLELGSRFNQAKSAIKWLEAALVHTPTIASPTEPFVEAIRDGTTGRLARDPEDWIRAIEQLLDDDDARARMGRMAGRDALLESGPSLQGRRYVALLDRAVERVTAGRRSRHSAWEPVVVDERPTPRVLEPYAAGEARLQRAVHATDAQLRWAARKLMRSITEEGAATTARKVGRSLRGRAHTS